MRMERIGLTSWQLSLPVEVRRGKITPLQRIRENPCTYTMHEFMKLTECSQAPLLVDFVRGDRA